MKPWIKWTAGGVGVLVLLVAGAAVLGAQMAERRMNRVVQVAVKPVADASGELALERGKYLFLSRGCTDCHGASGGGRDFVNDGAMRLRGPDISQGGVVAGYQPEDWVRIIRHGVKPDGRPAMVMPSEDYNRFTDEDLAALVAYVRSLPPAKGGPGAVDLPLPVRVLYGFGAIPEAAAKIDHTLPPAQPVPAAVDARHGAYVANACIGCHGEKLAGGKIPGGPPDWPAAANLTPGEGTAMSRYTDAAAFTAMLRTGKRPDGTAIAVMPFESLAKMNDVDAQALFTYLKTVPPRKLGER
ncbi:c-type cytochrome [Caenimonas sedimenti]|uniref:C-type cytochrome n=1 Tax=Caenimonas sedimenti TaxID=2596921 RepID=A0A562ZJX7_9BURK|nr:c-type cytochrome [Caenimonas sedimenti]TWO68892.1 c-type cytochrome [Caenimonas sedimenti]